MSKVLITGANGFIGHAVCKTLRKSGHTLSGTSRDQSLRTGPEHIPLYHVPDFGSDTDWTQPLAGADAVVHLAARVHVIRERASNSLAQHRRANRDGTKRLAEAAAEAGVKVNILLAPKDQYWDFSGDKAFAVSAWGVRIPGLIYNLVYKCDHPWGSSPWCDKEFDSLVEAAELLESPDERDVLYKQAGQILAENGGLINPAFTLAIDAQRKECSGFVPPFPFYQRVFNSFECVR